MLCYLYEIDYMILDTYLQWWNKMGKRNGGEGRKLMLKHHGWELRAPGFPVLCLDVTINQFFFSIILSYNKLQIQSCGCSLKSFVNTIVPHSSTSWLFFILPSLQEEMVTISVLDLPNALQDRRNLWPLQWEAFILPLVVAVAWYLVGGSSPKSMKLPFLSPIAFLCFWWVVTERTFLFLLLFPWRAVAACQSTSWTLGGISTAVAGTKVAVLHLWDTGIGRKIIALCRLKCIW